MCLYCLAPAGVFTLHIANAHLSQFVIGIAATGDKHIPDPGLLGQFSLASAPDYVLSPRVA